MNAPFILTRIKFPKVKLTTKTNGVARCYFCDKKIKHEKGYSTFYRQHEDYNDPKNYACHRDDCKYKLISRVAVYKYKDVKHNAAYDYWY